MLIHRLRRWININLAQSKRFVRFDHLIDSCSIPDKLRICVISDYVFQGEGVSKRTSCFYLRKKVIVLQNFFPTELVFS